MQMALTWTGPSVKHKFQRVSRCSRSGHRDMIERDMIEQANWIQEQDSNLHRNVQSVASCR
jgi:hypothetical protein